MNLILPIYSIFLLIILNFAFFTKKRVNSDETKSYSVLIILSSFNIIFNTIGISLGYFDGVSDFLYALNHFDLPLYFWWTSVMFLYLLFVYMNTTGRRQTYFKIKKIIIVINILITILTIFLPFEVVITETAGYAIGTCVSVVYLVSGIYLIMSFITAVLLVIKKQFKKIIPLLSLITLGIIAALIQKTVPSLIIIPSVAVLVEFIMYFTIENPDLKVVNELLRNKELVEKGMDDKTRFLFETSQEIKTPTKNILGITKNYDKLDNDIDKKDAVRMIESNANNILFRLNNVLDISSMDANKIKIKNESYNTELFFDNIKSITKNAIGNKKIQLMFNVSGNVPKKINGDNVKFKQILMSVIFNSIENTKSGFINISVDGIVRYDVCRLIIKIEDSGIGMDIDKVNFILDDNRELTIEETEKLNKLDMDLMAAIKSLKLLGGSFNIKSEKNKGSIFTIVLDQKCDINQKTDIMKNVEKYSSDFFGKKRVLIVDDNKEELFQISNILSKYNVDINTTMSGKDCVDRINAREFYNLILIDDELKNNSAFAVLKKLKENKKFKIPVVVMLEKNKEHFKDYYMNDGFNNIILKENLSEDLEKIINKLLW